MKCPRCGKDSINAIVCPFCTEPLITFEPTENKGANSNAIKRMARQLSLLELRSKLTVLLLCGFFLLQLLMLILIAIK